MTDLERRALLGDKEAQKECTRQGILLPCNCGGKAVRLKPTAYHSYRVACEVCRMNTGGYKTQEDADAAWNNRPAPPIGRCGECANWYKYHCAHGPCAAEPTDSLFYWADFEPKEHEDS